MSVDKRALLYHVWFLPGLVVQLLFSHRVWSQDVYVRVVFVYSTDHVSQFLPEPRHRHTVNNCQLRHTNATTHCIQTTSPVVPSITSSSFVHLGTWYNIIQRWHAWIMKWRLVNMDADEEKLNRFNRFSLLKLLAFLLLHHRSSVVRL